jgi:tRNA-specific 2-thiouridylase
MSGGLDSSVAAALLQSQGHEVFGLTAKTWPSGSRCCSDEDIRSARRVAAHLGIPHYVLDLSERFEQDVVRYFADEYATGRTPAPCAVCNRRIKFGSILDKALRLGAAHLATGHYARVVARKDGTLRLLRGNDKEKDQSYFLFDLTQRQLARALFPIGEMTKEEVRQSAARHEVPITKRGESQDLCFATPGEHWRITERYRPEVREQGRFVDARGQELGRHQGIHHFTIGQRRGLGIAGSKPLYVAWLCADRNEIVLGERDLLASACCTVGRVRWTSGAIRQTAFGASTKIRYNQAPAASRVSPAPDSSAAVVFDEPQFAVTPGQVAAFYDGDELVGGGWISAEPGGKPA